MKIVITGIDGLIGSALAKKLIADGHRVTGFSNGRGDSSQYKFYCADITDRKAVFNVFEKEKPDIVIHLAAMAHADVGPDRKAMVRRVNVTGSLNVAEAAEMHGGKKLIYFSSVKVLTETTVPDGIDEDAEPNPKGIYARFKREVEVELMNRTDEGRLSATIVRPATVIGSGDKKGNFAKVKRAVEKGFFPLIDGGSAKRSIVFLDRLTERVRLMIDKGIEPGEVFTLSDGAFAIREIVDTMRNLSGYAWCPSVSSKTIEWMLKLGKISRIGSAEKLRKVLIRLTENFVVKSHRWDQRYGALPELNLYEQLRKVYPNNF